MRLLRTTMALCAFFVPAAIVAGCGDEGGIPGNAVAEVDGTPIERTEYDHWLNVAAKSSGAPNAAVPKPPEFTECVAQAKKTQAKPAEGQPKLTDQQLKDQCKQQYEQLRDQVLGLLISFEWIEREAADQGVKVTDEEVNKSFEEQKKQTFPKDADYQKFLKDSGQTEEDVRMRVRLDLLSNKIRDKVIKGKDQVSEQQITDYYNKNKERFAQPERRDLSIVLTKTEAKANEAKQALQDGESFKSVAKEYSTDDASKAQGGKLPAVAKGQQEKAFDDAIFAADKGKITGPVKTQFGFYVFKVDKIVEASQQTRDEAKETIKQLLASQNQQKALDAYVKDFRKRWKEKTDCREGFVTQDCKNAPKATPTPTPGTAPAAPPPEQ
ncbi:MAG TPA: peptidyl-prolyl cis-trans isomerase [Solirubrobacteraceae bacterium]|nr:peptidyl-prolyl cis-trans isomerase [Solirubrobacteraceae bacterium]